MNRLMFAFMISIASTSTLLGQTNDFQLIKPPERYDLYRQLIPALKDNSEISAKTMEGLLYTKIEMPPVYQYQTLRDIGGGRRAGDPLAVFFTTAFPLDVDALKKVNENELPPWGKSGGLELVPPGQAETFFGWWSPVDEGGNILPMVFWPEKLEADPRGFVAPVGLKGLAPVNQINYDVLVRTFSDGTKIPFEMRAILQELGDRDVERYMPHARFSGMRMWFAEHGVNLPEPKWLAGPAFSAGNFVQLKRRFSANKKLTSASWVYCMPQISMSLAKEYLSDAKAIGFEPMKGDAWADYDGEKFSYGAIANDDNNWVPRGYTGSHAGSDNLSCANCHTDILRHVNSFGSILVPRHSFWIGGFNGLHTINPIDPASVGPPDTKDVIQRVRQPNGQITQRTVKVPRVPTLNPVLVRAGLVAMYDPEKHLNKYYQRMRGFDPK